MKIKLCLLNDDFEIDKLMTPDNLLRMHEANGYVDILKQILFAQQFIAW